LGEPSFLNLYYLRESAFRNHNFSDFSNDGAGGDPFVKIGASEIEALLKASYESDPTHPERMNGFPPEFDRIFPLTLSIPGAGVHSKVV